MALETAPTRASTVAATARRLFLIWQDPETRQLIKVGQLEELVDGHYVFTYLPGARHDGFSPLVQYPEIDGWYPSTTLPAFFVNRVMSRSRPSYGEFRHWIGLDNEGSDTPFEVLVRTGGPRVTDTFHVVDDLTWTQGGRVVSRFLASGVRHVPGAAERLRGLAEGQRLGLRDEPENPVNPRAILIDVCSGEPVGFVPDWLVEDVHDLRECTDEFVVIAERVNIDAPAHLRLLCRIEARLSDGG